MNSPLHRYIIALLLIASSAGCVRLWGRTELDYRTVAADPNHDTEQAKQENEKALQALERGRLDKAERHLQKALIADVAYGPAHNNLGRMYFSQTKYYLAAWEFEYAIKLMPDQPEPYNNLGLVYEKVGKLDEAIETYETAVNLQATNPEVLGNLARARLRRGDPPAEVQPLLHNLIFYDTRSDWVAWAKHQIAIPPKMSPAEFPLSETPHEIIPAPQGVPAMIQDENEEELQRSSPQRLPDFPKESTSNPIMSAPLPPQQ